MSDEPENASSWRSLSGKLPRASVRIEWDDGRVLEYEFVDVISAVMPMTPAMEVVSDGTDHERIFISTAMLAGKSVGYREEGFPSPPEVPVKP
jgi:hypothetical protein